MHEQSEPDVAMETSQPGPSGDGATGHRPPALVETRLSAMMFLQYAIWGAWLPLLWPFLSGHRGFDGGEIGIMFSVGAVGAIVAPFIAGQLADRSIPTERVLGVSHLLGAVLVWQLAGIASFWGFLVFSLAYSLIYSPTLSLTNSLSFHHLVDRDRQFGRIRVWGTVGWIVVGIGIGQWLLHTHTPGETDQHRLAVEREMAADDDRARLRTHVEVRPTGGDLVIGVVVEGGAEGDETIVLDPDPAAGADGRDERLVELEMTAVESVRPLYATLATPGQEARVLAALNRLDVDASTFTIDSVAGELEAAGALADETLGRAINAAQQAGMADAFRLSAMLGLLMGLYCFTLPHTPPSKGERRSAVAEAMTEVRRQPLLMLFLIAIPISCIHQFYFVHTSGFLGTFQSRAASSINDVFGVGGGGLMTVGQMSEVLVLALIPLVAKRWSRKLLLLIGIVAYAARMALFGYAEQLAVATGAGELLFIIPGIAMHGLCFGCFIFVAFMVVDEETTPDVRATAQSLFSLIIFGIGIIVGSLVAGEVAEWATRSDGSMNYTRLFSIPMWAAVACLAIMLVGYPGRSPKRGERAPAA